MEGYDIKDADGRVVGTIEPKVGSGGSAAAGCGCLLLGIVAVVVAVMWKLSGDAPPTNASASNRAISLPASPACSPSDSSSRSGTPDGIVRAVREVALELEASQSVTGWRDRADESWLAIRPTLATEAGKLLDEVNPPYTQAVTDDFIWSLLQYQFFRRDNGGDVNGTWSKGDLTPLGRWYGLLVAKGDDGYADELSDPLVVHLRASGATELRRQVTAWKLDHD